MVSLCHSLLCIKTQEGHLLTHLAEVCILWVLARDEWKEAFADRYHHDNEHGDVRLLHEVRRHWVKNAAFSRRQTCRPTGVPRRHAIHRRVRDYRSIVPRVQRLAVVRHARRSQQRLQQTVTYNYIQYAHDNKSRFAKHPTRRYCHGVGMGK